MIRRIAASPSSRLIGKRVVQAVPVLAGVSLLVFSLMNLLPGGSAAAIAGAGATKVQIAAVAHRLHLDQPFWERYWHWVTQALSGNLGTSLASGQPVTSILGTRLPVTAEMVGLALVLAIVISIPLAVLAVRRPRGIIDRLTIVLCMCGLSIPGFVLGLIAILLFAVKLHWLPAIGFVPISGGIWSNLKTVILPASTLGFTLMCNYTRVLRADLADQLNSEDYVVTARAKGVRPAQILIRHVLRNSMFSFITLVGLNLGILIGGTVLIEQIFALPGMGSELVQSIQIEDVPVVESIAVLLSVTVVLASLATDLLYTVLDPRIRYGRESNS
jgi:peptide/nickel transport system permease protein